jgi:hypothetical protein
MRTSWFFALAVCIALAPCVAQAAANPFAGVWKNAVDDQGIVIWSGGTALFFDNQQICPTFWSKYTVQDPHTAIAISTKGDNERKTLSLDADGMLHDSTTRIVYKRIGEEHAGVTFKKSTAHSCTTSK